jgi:hypothetical protein
MELSSLMRDKYVAYAKRAITHLGRVKLAFTISSLGYCAVHWLMFHGFSVNALSTAMAFGAVAAMVAARLAYWFSTF